MTAMAKPRHISATCRYYPSISRPRLHWPSLHWISACRKCTDLHGPALDARAGRAEVQPLGLVASAGAYSARSQSVSLAWGRIVYIGSDGYVGDHDHLPRWVAASLIGAKRPCAAEG